MLVTAISPNLALFVVEQTGQHVYRAETEAADVQFTHSALGSPRRCISTVAMLSS